MNSPACPSFILWLISSLLVLFTLLRLSRLGLGLRVIERRQTKVEGSGGRGRRGVVEKQGGGKRRNSKKDVEPNRRKTSDFNTKKTSKDKSKNKQEFMIYVCVFFNIKNLCPNCPPYNMQKADFLPSI